MVVIPNVAFLGSVWIGFFFNTGNVPLLALIGGFWKVIIASSAVKFAL